MNAAYENLPSASVLDEFSASEFKRGHPTLIYDKHVKWPKTATNSIRKMVLSDLRIKIREITEALLERTYALALKIIERKGA